MSFASYTLENHSPSKATILAYGFKGGIPIEYGKSHTFDAGSGLNVVAEGQVLFDIILQFDGPLEVKPRDSYDPAKFKVVFSVNPQKSD